MRADAVMKCCDAVTKWVVTASCRVGDAVSRLYEYKSSRVLALVRRILGCRTCFQGSAGKDKGRMKSQLQKVNNDDSLA
ncbi:hypothetical protein Tco_0807838 [Tanacetum coccineum]